MSKSLAKNPLRERIFYVKLDRVLVPLAMSGIEEMIKGTHPSFEGIKPAVKANLQLQAMREVLNHMPKRVEDKMDAKEIAEISRRPGVIIFPMPPVGSQTLGSGEQTLPEPPRTIIKHESSLNREELLEAAGVELADVEEDEEVGLTED
jgi:hypothetical protein